MNGNSELLNFIYQNTEMGVDSITEILNIIKDEDFKTHLRKQLAGYEKYQNEAKQLLHENGHDEKGIGMFKKIRTYLMTNMMTLKDPSTSNVAKMLIEGSTMGVTQATQNLNQYEHAEEKIIHLLKDLISFEEKNVEDLKKFL